MKGKNKEITLASIMLDTNRIDSLCQRVSGHINQARQRVQRTIDAEMVKAYWLIGQEIVQEEQYGKERSEYGKAVLKNLSERLQKQYKRGLERQIGSLLFDRLAKSRDKEGLLKLAFKGQEVIAPEDAIKDPLVLEFFGARKFFCFYDGA